MASIFVAVISTFVLTLLGCSRYYSARLKEQELRFQARFAEMIDRLNHAGRVPVAASLAGLTDITLRALARCIERLLKLLNAQDWNTTEVITELQMMHSNEFRLISKLIVKFLDDTHTILRDYNKDQGV